MEEEEEERAGGFDHYESDDYDPPHQRAGDTVKAVCPDCSGIRNCEVLFDTENEETEHTSEGCPPYSYDCFTVLKCRGCGKIFFRHVHLFSGRTDREGNTIEQTEYYPKKVIREKKIGRKFGFSGIPSCTNFVNLVNETYEAINHELPIVAAMALRSVCDQIFIIAAGDKGGFANNLDNCVKEGHLSVKQQEVIKAALDIGHAAVHRGYSPTMHEVLAALDIVEHTAEQLLENKHKARTLAAKVPPRNRP